MGFYIESADRPYTSRVVSTDIRTGEIGATDGSNGAEPFDAGSHGDDNLLGVATQPRRGDYIAEEEDVTTNYLYEAAEDDRASFGGDEDRGVIKARTIEDAGGSAPSITGDRTVVGIIDSSDANAPSGAKGRLVEEGYTADADGDGTSTTFNRTNGNFYPLGVAYRDESTSYDEPVRVQVRRDL